MMEGQGRYRTSKNSSLLSVLIIGGDRLAGWKDKVQVRARIIVCYPCLLLEGIDWQDGRTGTEE